MNKERSVNWFYASYVKPLIEAVAKRGTDLNFDNLRKILSEADNFLTKEDTSKLDPLVIKFIQSLYPQDLVSRESLLGYLRGMESDLYKLFYVYNLVHDLEVPHEDKVLDEIDKFLDCDEEFENSILSNSVVIRQFNILLNICKLSGLKVNESKVSIENLKDLAKSTILDIYDKSCRLGYKTLEVAGILYFLDPSFDIDNPKSNIGINKKDVISEGRLWKEIYDKLSDIVRESSYITSDGLVICGSSEMLNRISELVNDPIYKKLTKTLRDKLAKSTYSSELIDYVFDYVSSKIKLYEGN